MALVIIGPATMMVARMISSRDCLTFNTSSRKIPDSAVLFSSNPWVSQPQNDRRKIPTLITLLQINFACWRHVYGLFVLSLATSWHFCLLAMNRWLKKRKAGSSAWTWACHPATVLAISAQPSATKCVASQRDEGIRNGWAKAAYYSVYINELIRSPPTVGSDQSQTDSVSWSIQSYVTL